MQTMLSFAGNGKGKGNWAAPREWGDIRDFCMACCPIPALPSVTRTIWEKMHELKGKKKTTTLQQQQKIITRSVRGTGKKSLIYLTGSSIPPLLQDMLSCTNQPNINARFISFFYQIQGIFYGFKIPCKGHKDFVHRGKGNL